MGQPTWGRWMTAAATLTAAALWLIPPGAKAQLLDDGSGDPDPPTVDVDPYGFNGRDPFWYERGGPAHRPTPPRRRRTLAVSLQPGDLPEDGSTGDAEPDTSAGEGPWLPADGNRARRSLDTDNGSGSGSGSGSGGDDGEASGAGEETGGRSAGSNWPPPVAPVCRSAAVDLTTLLPAARQVTFSPRSACPRLGARATFDNHTSIDAGLGASVFVTIYKRLGLSEDLPGLIHLLNAHRFSCVDPGA